MELDGGKCGSAVKSLSDTSKIYILSLDDLALEGILLKCDPISYMNLRRSCRRFYTLSLKCINERTWEQYIRKRLVHFLSTIIECSDVTNNEDHYYRNIRRYDYDVEPYIVRADIAELILSLLLQSVRLINYINNCDTHDMSLVIHKMIMYSLRAKDLHMKSIYSVFYILGVSECYVFEERKGRGGDDTIVLCKTMSGFKIFSYNCERKNLQSPMVFYYMENYKEWSTKGDPYRNSYDDVKRICEKLSWRIFNNKGTITPETLIEFCKFPLRTEMKEGQHLYEGDGANDALDASTKMNAIQSTKERLFTNCVDFVSHLQRTELKKPNYDASDTLDMLLQPLIAFCDLSKLKSIERFINNLIDSVEPFAKLFMAARKPFFPNLVQILSLVDVMRSNIGFYKEKTEKQLVFSVGSNEVAFRKADERGYLAVLNSRTFKLDTRVETDEEKKNTDELLAVFNDHLKLSLGVADEQPTKVTLDLLSSLCFHVLGF